MKNFFVSVFVDLIIAVSLVSCAANRVVTTQACQPAINIKMNYIEILQKKGSAAALILDADSVETLQLILQLLIRESETGLTIWEERINGRLSPNEVNGKEDWKKLHKIKEDIANTQCACTKELFNAKVEVDLLLPKLRQLDCLTTQLAHGIKRKRPLFMK